MLIFLPEKDSGLKVFLRKLNAKTWDEWMGRLTMTEGRIKLPRFKMEYEATLNGPLKSLGMGLAFDPGKADFSAMLSMKEKAYISEVKHKTFAQVNEEGTEAAAVTSIGIRATAFRPAEKVFQMIVDHPFFCAIRDRQTGEILFMGIVADPS